jgi:hypothetical protein
MSSYSFIVNHNITDGNITTTNAGTVFVNPENPYILCGYVQAIAGSDHTATVSITFTFDGVLYVIPIITLDSNKNIPFTLPIVSGDSGLNITYSINVTGTNGQYTIRFMVK